jgi:hypothetical protein
MNRFGINKISSVTLLTIGFAFVSFSTTTPLQATTVEECSKELLLSFFPDEFVVEVLQKYQISKEKWEPIVKGLNDKNDDVLKLIDEQASKMDPNPLKDPSQKQVAVKIFRESLLQVFSSVLIANGVTDSQKIQSMLGDIQQMKTKRFAQCIESQKPATAAPGASTSPVAPAKLAENEQPPKIDAAKIDAAKNDKKDNDNDDDDSDDDDADDDEDHPASIASSDIDETDDEDDYHY